MLKEKLRCRLASERLSQSLDQELPAAERLALEAHLKLCDACRHLETQLKFMREAMRRYRDRR